MSLLENIVSFIGLFCKRDNFKEPINRSHPIGRKKNLCNYYTRVRIRNIASAVTYTLTGRRKKKRNIQKKISQKNVSALITRK